MLQMKAELEHRKNADSSSGVSRSFGQDACSKLRGELEHWKKCMLQLRAELQHRKKKCMLQLRCQLQHRKDACSRSGVSWIVGMTHASATGWAGASQKMYGLAWL